MLTSGQDWRPKYSQGNVNTASTLKADQCKVGIVTVGHCPQCVYLLSTCHIFKEVERGKEGRGEMRGKDRMGEGRGWRVEWREEGEEGEGSLVPRTNLRGESW